MTRLIFTRQPSRVWQAIKTCAAYLLGATLTLGAWWAAAVVLFSLEG